jgi:hypothetical protein
LKPSKNLLEKVYGGIMKEVNDLQLQIDSKKTFSCIDCQGKSFNTNTRNCIELPESSQRAPRELPESSQRAPRELPESSPRAPRELPSPSLSEVCVLISLSKTADKQSFLGKT